VLRCSSSIRRLASELRLRRRREPTAGADLVGLHREPDQCRRLNARRGGRNTLLPLYRRGRGLAECLRAGHTRRARYRRSRRRHRQHRGHSRRLGQPGRLGIRPTSSSARPRSMLDHARCAPRRASVVTSFDANGLTRNSAPGARRETAATRQPAGALRFQDEPSADLGSCRSMNCVNGDKDGNRPTFSSHGCSSDVSTSRARKPRADDGSRDRTRFDPPLGSGRALAGAFRYEPRPHAARRGRVRSRDGRGIEGGHDACGVEARIRRDRAIDRGRAELEVGLDGRPPGDRAVESGPCADVGGRERRYSLGALPARRASASPRPRRYRGRKGVPAAPPLALEPSALVGFAVQPDEIGARSGFATSPKPEFAMPVGVSS